MAEAKRPVYQRPPDASNPDAQMLKKLEDLKKQDKYAIYFAQTPER